MTAERVPRSALDVLKQHAPEAADAFSALRRSLTGAGSLPPATQELIVSATFVVTGQEGAFRTHARRALQHGASLADLQQAVLLTLGATATLAQVASALRWLEALEAS
ncbi:MAG TPA: carboxymuconolactone decarboxylase family protein [Chloroflexota bacterium]|jgi:alkylhydroperoxidase/carboxymuconolactone decarboxylase family protein YurZ|nr:carboxymuconolactone decarboxylase family protein [Chloroflexota bacterium]